MAYTLTGLTSGVLVNIEEEDVRKDANLFAQALPRSDSSAAIVMDLFGVTRTIRLRGVFVGGTAGKTVKQFVVELDALVSGTQTVKEYHSDTSDVTYYVFVDSVNWRYSHGGPLSVVYEISLVEAKN